MTGCLANLDADGLLQYCIYYKLLMMRPMQRLANHVCNHRPCNVSVVMAICVSAVGASASGDAYECL